MNQLRTSDLFRYKQNYMVHKQKVKNIMNRSSQSIKHLSQRQSILLQKNKASHEKALHFKRKQNSRSIDKVNQSFVNRMISNDSVKTKSILKKSVERSFSQILKARQSLMRNSLHSASSRITLLEKDHQTYRRKINSVRSTISCKDFHNEYNKHEERSSMLSKFKIDAKSFKFIPKNQIILGQIKNKNPTCQSQLSTKNPFDAKRLHASRQQAKGPEVKRLNAKGLDLNGVDAKGPNTKRSDAKGLDLKGLVDESKQNSLLRLSSQSLSRILPAKMQTRSIFQNVKLEGFRRKSSPISSKSSAFKDFKSQINPQLRQSSLSKTKIS